MTFQPNRQPISSQRQPAIQRGYVATIPPKKPNWILWVSLTIVGVALAVVVGLRLQYQSTLSQNDAAITAMVAQADKLIAENKEDEAEAVVSKGVDLIPGDVRCQNTIERINAKRKLILKNKTEAGQGELLAAEQLAHNDIALAIDAYGRIAADDNLTPEAHKAAVERSSALKRGVCSLRLPEDWPSEAVVVIDKITKNVVKKLVTDIVPGKHTVQITRYGYRTPEAMELNFRGLDPLPLPPILWQTRGAKVFVRSEPAGAAVWWKGKNTGKVTPCEIEDADDGPIEFVLKLPKHEVTSLKGEVKDQKPIALIATLNPL